MPNKLASNRRNKGKDLIKTRSEEADKENPKCRQESKSSSQTSISIQQLYYKESIKLDAFYNDSNTLKNKILDSFKLFGQHFDIKKFAHDMPALSYILDFHDPEALLYEFYNNHFEDNIESLQRIDQNQLFIKNKQMEAFIDKSINEEFLINIPEDTGGIDKSYFFIAGRIIENLQILNQKMKNRSTATIDEGSWTMVTIDSFIYNMYKFFDNNLEVSWGQKINPTTRCSKNKDSYDSLIINSYKSKEEKEKKEKVPGKKPDVSIYWRNDQYETSIALVEASLGPFEDPDIVKFEGDRRKLIQCIKSSSQKLWNDLATKGNRYIQESNFIEIKAMLRPIIQLNGTSITFLYYDEAFFPIGRVRLHSEIQIPYHSLEPDNIKAFVYKLLSVYKTITNYSICLKSFLDKLKQNKSEGKRFAPISNLINNYPSRILAPKKQKK